MISVEEAKFASLLIPGAIETPRIKQKRLLDREIEIYLKNGGIVTRREQSGSLSFWAGTDINNLKRITLKQRNALLKAHQEEE